MIYAINEGTGVLVGKFDTLALARLHIGTLLGNTNFKYTFLQDVSSMNYVSRVTYVDGVCIYNSKDFWVNQSYQVLESFEGHEVRDCFGVDVTEERFRTEYEENCTRMQKVVDSATEVNHNMKVGFEFIALFREECINSPSLDGFSSLQIAAQTMDLVPLLLTGSFREGVMWLYGFTPNDFFTAERLARYRTMLTVADVISYNR